MAKYRAVQTTFWEDSKIVDEFNADDRYIFLYLLTNPRTNQLGCYEMPTSQISKDTGFSKSKIEKILSKLENELKVIIRDEDTKEIYLINWYKYNWLNSDKTKKCIEKEFSLIKSTKLKSLISPLYTPYMTLGEKEKEKRKRKIKKREEINKEERDIGNSVASSPTLNEIISYASKEFEIENKEYCEKFYNHYESIGWVNGTGQRIKNWKLIFNNWIKSDGIANKKKTNKYMALDENGELIEVEK